jgi:hypothetical protein
MVWNNVTVVNPELPSPDGYGWQLVDKEWVPIMTKQFPAPNAILNLVKCACVKSKCSTNLCCCCRKAGLNCTDLCCCSDSDDDGCEKMEDEHEWIGRDCFDEDDDFDENDVDYFEYDDDDGHVK